MVRGLALAAAAVPDGTSWLHRFTGRVRFVRARKLQAHQQGHRQDGRQDGQGQIFFFSEHFASGAAHALRRPPNHRFGTKRRKAPAGLARLAAPALLAALAPAAPAAAQELAFAESGPLESDTGHALIEWRAPGEATLIMARSPDFAEARALYRGGNTAYFLSGLEGGDYYLLLRDDAGGQSQALRLTVAHQSLGRAIWLTVIGAFITLGIVAAILRGARP